MTKNSSFTIDDNVEDNQAAKASGRVLSTDEMQARLFASDGQESDTDQLKTEGTETGPDTDTGTEINQAVVQVEPQKTPTQDEGSPNTETTTEPLAAVQFVFALVLLKGAYYGLKREPVEQQKRAGKAPKLELLTKSDLALAIRRQLRAKCPQADGQRITQEFLESPDTTCYEGIEFNPRATTPNYVNLWVGPTTQPRKGNSRPILEFLFFVICAADPHAFEYLRRYFAHALQRPWEKPGVMISLLDGAATRRTATRQPAATKMQPHALAMRGDIPLRIMRLHRHVSTFRGRFQAPLYRSRKAPASQGLSTEDDRGVRAGRAPDCRTLRVSDR